MKNFEIPANEIDALDFMGEYYTGDDFEPSDATDVFPATFIITKTVIEAFFRERGVDLATVKLFNSEGDGDHEKLPKFSALMSAQWGFGEDENGEDIEAPFDAKSDDLYFEYGWSDNYSRFYELTINGKPALLIDGSDGTTCSNFSWIEVIFAT